MKTTGMTHDRVEELNGEFKKMDTHTSREALNNPARDAGKSGLPGKKIFRILSKPVIGLMSPRVKTRATALSKTSKSGRKKTVRQP
jgi:hypothetical protein